MPSPIRNNTVQLTTRERWIEALHIVAGCAFAVAQPAFDILGRNATFFSAHRANGAQVLLLTFVLAIGVALVLIVIERVVLLVSFAAYRLLHTALIGVLVGLTIAPPAGRILGNAGWFAAFVIAGGGAAVLYAKRARFYKLLTWLAPAAAVFAALFLSTTGVRGLVLPQTSERADVETNKTPIAIFVLDEFPLGALLTTGGEVDEKRFPNLARLAAMSTWYSNATTNGESTFKAVPALLTGDLGKEEEVPDLQGYPENLFTMLGPTYDLSVAQSVTNLCPPEYCAEAKEAGSTDLLFEDVAVVYLHVALPEAIARATLPELGAEWGGFRDQEGRPDKEGRGGKPRRAERRKPLTTIPEPARTGLIYDHYRGIRKGSERLWYAHVSIPHRPWEFLPTGQRLSANNAVPGHRGTHPESWAPDPHQVDHALQRFMLQAQFGDLLLGQALDRLEKTGALDDTLLIVAADHGISFEIDSDVRSLDESNEGDILPVPLFIKYPGQSKGTKTPRFAELIDVVPTIADVLETEVPWKVAGTSLLGPEEPRQRKAALVPRGMRTYPPDTIKGPERLAQMIRDTFGEHRGAYDIYDFGPSRLVGEQVDDLSVGRNGGQASVADVGQFEDVDPDADVLPSFIRGFIGRPSADEEKMLAIAINGTIAGVGWSYESGGRSAFAIMTTPRLLKPGTNEVRMFTVDSATVLREIALN